MRSDWLLYLASFVFVFIVTALAVFCGPGITALALCGLTGIALALRAVLRPNGKKPEIPAARESASKHRSHQVDALRSSARSVAAYQHFPAKKGSPLKEAAPKIVAFGDANTQNHGREELVSEPTATSQAEPVSGKCLSPAAVEPDRSAAPRSAVSASGFSELPTSDVPPVIPESTVEEQSRSHGGNVSHLRATDVVANAVKVKQNRFPSHRRKTWS